MMGLCLPNIGRSYYLLYFFPIKCFFLFAYNA